MTVTVMDGGSAKRARRSDRGEVQVTDRDVLGMSWVVEMYGMPFDLLHQLLGSSEQAIRNVVGRWRKAGWIETTHVYGGPSWVWATAGGIERFGAHPYPEREPSVSRIAHHRAVIRARIGLERRYADRYPIWTSERAVRHVAGVALRDKAVRIHMPDGVLEYDTAEGRTQAAIEVELVPKQPARVGEIVAELRRGVKSQWQGYPQVIYVVEQRARLAVARGLELMQDTYNEAYWRHVTVLDFEEVTR